VQSRIRGGSSLWRGEPANSVFISIHEQRIRHRSAWSCIRTHGSPKQTAKSLRKTRNPPVLRLGNVRVFLRGESGAVNALGSGGSDRKVHPSGQRPIWPTRARPASSAKLRRLPNGTGGKAKICPHLNFSRPTEPSVPNDTEPHWFETPARTLPESCPVQRIRASKFKFPARPRRSSERRREVQGFGPLSFRPFAAAHHFVVHLSLTQFTLSSPFSPFPFPSFGFVRISTLRSSQLVDPPRTYTPPCSHDARAAAATETGDFRIRISSHVSRFTLHASRFTLSSPTP